jgi:1,2-diacylglycerol 3-alpha-glucosyltransferase
MIRVLMVSDVFFPARERRVHVDRDLPPHARPAGRRGARGRAALRRRADDPGVVRVAGRRLPLDPEDRLSPGAP